MTLKVSTCVKYDECRCKVIGNLQWSFELNHGTANKKKPPQRMHPGIG